MRGRSPCASPPSMCTCLVGFLQCGKTATLLQQTLPSTCTHTLCRTHACMHAHLHTHTRAYIHTYTHTHTHTHTHTRQCMCIHAHGGHTMTQSCGQCLNTKGDLHSKKECTHTHTHACVQLFPQLQTHTHARVCLLTQKHTHTYTHQKTQACDHKQSLHHCVFV